MEQSAFQDDFARIGFQHCWGCGVANEHGLRLRSAWSEADPDEAICRWQPEAYHVAAPGIVNGGILATLIDCHSAATAVAAAYRALARPIGEGETLAYVTATLAVAYLRPTPAAGPLTLHARVTEKTERTITVACSVMSPSGEECARGTAVMVRVPATWRQAS
jgi:acyl-coenzyme A thioesterase PaaI-like protein